MSNDIRWIAPVPPPPDHEVLEVHQLTRTFYEEVQCRQSFECYCSWYATTAEKHRREVRKMHGDFNLLGWFYRGKQRK